MKNIAGLTLLLFTVAINVHAQNMDAFTKKLFIRSCEYTWHSPYEFERAHSTHG